MKNWLVVTEHGEYLPQNEYNFFETKEEAITFKDECFKEQLQKIRGCSNYTLNDYNEYKYYSFICYTNLFGKKSIEWKVIGIK